ncbi:hypothetical protein V4890_24090 [Ralstonia solanacearum species complex bacterium KE056]|uniref:hypothetical protein n=1 Tax=Ralstonia solanacearum species complex bacterium KE056 TaxID=3119585 RepID=UPI002FC2B55A
MPGQSDTLRIQYDVLGRPTERRIGSLSETWSYDPLGRKVGHGGAMGARVSSFFYETDAENRIVSMLEAGREGPKPHWYRYDAADQPAGRRQPQLERPALQLRRSGQPHRCVQPPGQADDRGGRAEPDADGERSAGLLKRLREHDQIDWSRASIDGATVADDA